MQSEKVKKASAATKKRLAEAAEKKALEKRHSEVIREINVNTKMQLQTMQALTSFLKGNTTKTEITNWIKSIGTPDILKLLPKIEKLDKTIKSNAVDWTPVLAVLGKMEGHLAQVPKEHPEAPEQSEVDLSDTNKLLRDIVTGFKAIKLEYKAPTIKVPAANVTVEKADLTEVKKPLEDILSAISSLVIPETVYTDTSTMEELLTEARDLLKKIEKKKFGGGGGGGGGGMVPFTDPVTGFSIQVPTEADHSLPVTIKGGGTPGKFSDEYGINAISEDATYKYFWFEADDSDYYIMRKNKTTSVFTFTKGTGGYTSVYVNETSGPSGSPTWGTRGATF